MLIYCLKSKNAHYYHASLRAYSNFTSRRGRYVIFLSIRYAAKRYAPRCNSKYNICITRRYALVCSMFALYPRSGDYSGASLEVPSEALLSRKGTIISSPYLTSRRGQSYCFCQLSLALSNISSCAIACSLIADCGSRPIARASRAAFCILRSIAAMNSCSSMITSFGTKIQDLRAIVWCFLVPIAYTLRKNRYDA